MKTVQTDSMGRNIYWIILVILKDDSSYSVNPIFLGIGSLRHAVTSINDLTRFCCCCCRSSWSSSGGSSGPRTSASPSSPSGSRPSGRPSREKLTTKTESRLRSPSQSKSKNVSTRGAAWHNGQCSRFSPSSHGFESQLLSIFPMMLSGQ